MFIKVKTLYVPTLLLAVSINVIAPYSHGQSRAQRAAASQKSRGAVPLPTFEVVSVKLSRSRVGPIRMMLPDDGYSVKNVTLKDLINEAYGVRKELILNAPGWADSNRYDVDAKVASTDVEQLRKLTVAQRWQMLRPVLADRFHLKVHSETKVRSVYDLIISKDGSKLHEAGPGNTYPGAIKVGEGVPHTDVATMRPGLLIGQALSMSSLAKLLSIQLHRTVINKTGLTGQYDLTLKWGAGENSMQAGEQGLPLEPSAQPGTTSTQQLLTAVPTSDVSIFTAIQEQLGLKLASAKGPVEFVVVDHAQTVTSN